MFHRVEAFFSMGILEEELAKMDKIIAIKKKKKIDFDLWEMKKGTIELKINVNIINLRQLKIMLKWVYSI